MKVRHLDRAYNVQVDAYVVLVEDAPSVYYLRTFAGKGRGGFNEPSVTVEFTARELRDFAVSLISLVAVDESVNRNV